METEVLLHPENVSVDADNKHYHYTDTQGRAAMFHCPRLKTNIFIFVILLTLLETAKGNMPKVYDGSKRYDTEDQSLALNGIWYPGCFHNRLAWGNFRNTHTVFLPSPGALGDQRCMFLSLADHKFKARKSRGTRTWMQHFFIFIFSNRSSGDW